MHVRFTRSVAAHGACCDPGMRCVPVRRRASRQRERRALDLAAELHADRTPRHGPARRHGARRDGSVQDQTRSVEWVSSNPSVASVTPKGRVIPKGNGTATIVARKGSLEASTTVKVEGMDQPARVSFRRDVIPAFSQAGCNTGACHGTPTGKGGLPAQPPRLPSRPGLFDPLARGRRPPHQPDGARDQPDLAQAAGADPARGRVCG